MDGTPRAITWEAPEHHHVEKGSDWFFALGIMVVALVLVAVLLDNVLFGILIGLAGGALTVSAIRGPKIIPFAVTVRGVRIGEQLHPYASLASYHIDEDNLRGPQLLLKSEQRFLPLLVVPIPATHVDDIDDILTERLEEEELVEPFLVKVMELFGF